MKNVCALLLASRVCVCVVFVACFLLVLRCVCHVCVCGGGLWVCVFVYAYVADGGRFGCPYVLRVRPKFSIVLGPVINVVAPSSM